MNGLVNQVPMLKGPLEEFKKGIADALQVPAKVLFFSLFLAILVGRVPSLQRPDTFLAFLIVVAALGLAVFAKLVHIPERWLRGTILGVLLSALLFFIYAPRLENVLQALTLRVRVIERQAAGRISPAPESVKLESIDPDRPPAFFTATGMPLFWYSKTRDGGYELYPSETHDRVTGKETQPLAGAEVDKFLTWLRAERESQNKATVEANVKLQQEQELQKQEQARADLENQKRSAERALVARQNRYLMLVDGGSDPTRPRLAVAVVGQDRLDSALTEAVCLMATRSGYLAINNLFKPEFITDGMFDRTFNGDSDLLTELLPTNRCEFLALCRFTAVIHPRPAFRGNVAEGTLAVKFLRAGNWGLLASRDYVASAAAFEPDEAVSLVRKKLIDVLATNSFTDTRVVQ